VRFVSGRASEETRPKPTGSAIRVKTIGIVWVALGRPRRRCADGEDDLRLKADQLGGEARKDFGFSLRVAPLESDVLPFDVAKIAESLRERLVPLDTGADLV
jgi:hypothetical protein